MKIPKLLVLGVLASTLCLVGSAQGQLHGIGLSKGTGGPYRIGEAYESQYLISNSPITNDTALDTLTVTSVIDVVHAAGGDVSSGNIIDLVTWNLSGGAYYVDANNTLILPSGSSALSDFFSFHTVTVADYLALVPLEDDVSITWQDACTSGSGNCPTGNQTATTGSQANILAPAPDTSVTILSSASEVCEGGTVTLTVTEINQGTTIDEALTNPYVDLQPIPLTLDELSPYFAGDGPGNDDDVLDPGETWTWIVTDVVVSTDTTFIAIGHGTDVLGRDVTWCQDPQNPPASTVCDQNERATADVVVVDAPECLIAGPDAVCEGTQPVQYSTSVTADTYLWTIEGDAVIVGVPPHTGTSVSVDPTGDGNFKLTLEVCFTNGFECCTTCDKTVDIIPTPDCTITGPVSICEEDIGEAVQYCSSGTADHYQWVLISGPADPLDPDLDNDDCVTVVPNALGTIVLELQLWNDVPPDGACGNSCRITILVEECGGTFCTFTQGFWGNAGGKKCDGQSTTQLIEAALLSGPVVVGLPGHSITLNSAQCILDLMPAGGTPAALPAGNFGCPVVAPLLPIPASILKEFKKKESRFNNVLIGQVVALTLNLRVSEGCVEESGILADWELPEEFCTVPYGDEEACAEYSSIPTKLVGLTVEELLAEANKVLAGQAAINDASIGDIYNAVTAINEGFDECRTLVPCIRPEICGNDCDDDGDGLTDCCDPDCNCEVCDNGIDDDCDGLIDGDDVDDCPQAGI